MNARAKFRCTEVKKTVHSSWGPPKTDADAVYVSFSPVLGDGNESWSRYTPAGTLCMTITNANLFTAFEAGKDYYLDISPAEAA